MEASLERSGSAVAWGFAWNVWGAWLFGGAGDAWSYHVDVMLINPEAFLASQLLRMKGVPSCQQERRRI